MRLSGRREWRERMCPYEIALWGGLRMPYAKELLYVYCTIEASMWEGAGTWDWRGRE